VGVCVCVWMRVWVCIFDCGSLRVLLLLHLICSHIMIVLRLYVCTCVCVRVCVCVRFSCVCLGSMQG